MGTTGGGIPGREGITMSEEKVKGVLEWKPLTSLTETQAFLGFSTGQASAQSQAFGFGLEGFGLERRNVRERLGVWKAGPPEKGYWVWLHERSEYEYDYEYTCI